MKASAVEPPLPDLVLCFVEGGEFLMGEGERIRPVRVSNFCMGRFPVTQKLWQAVMASNPSHFKGESRPVEMVSWHDAQQFLTRLNARHDVQDFARRLGCPGIQLRLPTEAEWEYAARGGKWSAGYHYAGSDSLEQVGWFYDNSGQETHAVGQLLGNELGIHDMSGNVWEWCGDWYAHSYSAEQHWQKVAVDPQGPAVGEWRVLRGGCWINDRSCCRTAYRFYGPPEFCNRYYGLRLILPSNQSGASQSFP